MCNFFKDMDWVLLFSCTCELEIRECPIFSLYRVTLWFTPCTFRSAEAAASPLYTFPFRSICLQVSPVTLSANSLPFPLKCIKQTRGRFNAPKVLSFSVPYLLNENCCDSHLPTVLALGFFHRLPGWLGYQLLSSRYTLPGSSGMLFILFLFCVPVRFKPIFVEKRRSLSPFFSLFFSPCLSMLLCAKWQH